MNLKKKLKKFFTLKRRANDGFTLVELIVVIAIMAILAGVGSVGYAGYIKSANKNADRVLVGNVMRAIQSGTYTHAFGTIDKLQPGDEGMQIPIGFVVLSEDGIEVLESGTEVGMTNSGKCQKSTQTIKAYLETKYGVKNFNTPRVLTLEPNSGNYWLKTSGSLNTYYCAQHMGQPTAITIAKLKEETGLTAIYLTSSNAKSSKNALADDKVYFVVDYCDFIECAGTESEAATLGTNHWDGREFESTPTYTGSFTVAQNGAISQMINAAFGNNPANMKLKYMEWNTDGSIPTFFANGPDVWSKVEELGDALVQLKGLGTAFGVDLSSVGDYENGAEAVCSFASALTTKYPTAADFYVQWKAVDDSADNSRAFDSTGYGFSEMEYYMAARAAYNEAFAAYVDATPAKENIHVGTNCSSNIRNYGFDLGTGVAPKQVCRSALKDCGQTLPAGLTAIYCPACYELYEQYVASGASKANCYAIYDTMKTVNSTADTATNSAQGFFDYYDSYLNEFSGLYSALESKIAEKESAIAIAAYYKNGLVDFDVLPFDADPRND